jgi:hypothetical protein
VTTTVTMVDAIAGDSRNIPSTAPAVAGYLTGAGIAWSAAEWARFTAARVRILQQWVSDTGTWLLADVLDVETGALTLAQAATIARFRATHKLATTIYIEASRLTAARAAVKGIASITFWVANWSITAAEAHAMVTGRVVAVQYASPDGGISTEALLPHTKLTIKQANVDLSVASLTWLSVIAARWPKKPAPVTAKKKTLKPHPKTMAGTIGAAAIAGASTFAKAKGIHLDGAESTLLTATGAFLTATLTPIKKKA